MVSTEQLLGFSAMALAIILIPGPTILFVVGRALAHGRRTAMASVLGNEIGALVLVVAVALGIGSIVERSVLVFTVLKLAGAAYIVYLGVQAFRNRRLAFEEEHSPRNRALWQGFVVGVSNPKTVVFLAAVLPQFVVPGNGGAPTQMLIFGLVFCLIALLCDSVWGLAAATARTWLTGSPRRLAAIGGTGGLMMIGLGVTVATTGRKD
ncbi:LysE family translocator [Actinomadura sp. 9N407]|uniref:LysE family translocator n=1 Tax=Actinomadura sp. 9N407 TaxID=3375154 RepID=UPI0037909A43